jgi:hypothetical protein
VLLLQTVVAVAAVAPVLLVLQVLGDQVMLELVDL